MPHNPFGGANFLSRLLISRFLSKFTFILPPKFFRAKYSGGKIYLPLRDSYRMIDKIFGVYEYQKTQFLKKLVHEGMTIVDVGANVGYYSLLFAKLMKCNGKVLAFEPYPELLYWLEKSIEVNDYDCITLLKTALADEQGTKTFYPGKLSGWGSLVYSPHAAKLNCQPIEVQVSPLDSVLRELRIGHVDLVKIDVEGAELMVLMGMKEALKARNIRLVIDVDTVSLQEEREQIYEVLVDNGFTIYRLSTDIIKINRIDSSLKEIYATKSSS